ncbi:MAG: filamentous hemagglutinin N-terminal domain-containing protein, partial [Sedimentisphaerales bacterium]
MMERIKRSLKGRYWRKVITYFLTCCLFLNTLLPAVMAGPSGGSPDFSDPRNGGASITYKDGLYGHTTTVNVDTTRTIINWDSLDTKGGDIDVRETLAFTQESLQGTLTGSAVLNRVSGATTQFNGDLVAPDMSIFIVNPAGVVFGTGSRVNVTQLVASGLYMSNDAFNAYLDDPDNIKMEFAGGDGEVINRAIITADSVYLIGKKVFNLGPIVAKDGLVVMAAGDTVSLYENGSDVSVVVSGLGDGDPDIRNSGNVDVLNGKIVLAAGDTFSRAVSNVSSLAAQGGEVSIQAAQVENRGWINVSAFPPSGDGDGGSISLTGTEQVVIGPDAKGNPSQIFANAGVNGNGGTITITATGTETVEGKVTIEKNSLITATGGSALGIDEVVPPSGGSVTITCDNFEIAGDIDASPGNKTFEPGQLVINSSSAIIADGPNPTDLDPPEELVENTLYEVDIEALSVAGTSLIVNAEEGITVKDITDNEITGQFGSIELHATGESSAVSFDDSDDTIRTSLGDIIIEAGSGGINVGNLTTGNDSDLPDEKSTPGQIFLTTNNGGNITTGDLIVRDGWGGAEDDGAEIDVKSSGSLTVEGDVMVGSESSPILNVADERAAEAVIILKADNDVELKGIVEAHADGSEEDTSITNAYIEIFAGGDAEMNGNLLAEAISSSSGSADAVITVEAVGGVDFPGTANAIANDATAESIGPDHQDDEETISNGHA